MVIGDGPMTIIESKSTDFDSSSSVEKPSRIIIDNNVCSQILSWKNPDPEMFDYIPMDKTTLAAGAT